MENNIPIDNLLLDRIYALHLTFADTYTIHETITRIKNTLLHTDKLQLDVIKLHMQLFYISNEQFEVSTDQLEQYFENMNSNYNPIENNPFARFFNNRSIHSNSLTNSSNNQIHSSYYVFETPTGVVMSFGGSNSNPSFLSSRTLNLPRGLNSLNELLHMISSFYNSNITHQEDVKLVIKSEVLQAMPTFKYDEIKDNITDNICSICQCDYENDETLIKLPCGHFFHETCISIWLGQQSHVCPICRTEAGEHIPLINNNENQLDSNQDDNIINQIDHENEEMDREFNLIDSINSLYTGIDLNAFVNRHIIDDNVITDGHSGINNKDDYISNESDDDFPSID